MCGHVEDGEVGCAPQAVGQAEAEPAGDAAGERRDHQLVEAVDAQGVADGRERVGERAALCRRAAISSDESTVRFATTRIRAFVDMASPLGKVDRALSLRPAVNLGLSPR